jgi:hypothetical protein
MTFFLDEHQNPDAIQELAKLERLFKKERSN